MRRIESDLQIGCVKWFRLQYPKLKKLLFSVPNGGTRNKKEVQRLKDEGIVAGVSDLVLAIPNKENNGVFIEMKTKKGVLSPEQKEFLSMVKYMGYRVEVVRSFESFVDVIESQLKGR